jgi:hypothetical protein
MNRSFVFTRTVLAVIGLLLVGPQKASAQTISACVNSVTGLLYVVAANASCPPSSGNVTWTKTTLSTTPLAAGHYYCLAGTYTAGTPFNFNPGVTFGSAIGTVTPPINSFTLAQGIYLIHLSGIGLRIPTGNTPPVIEALPPGIGSFPEWFTTAVTGADVLEISGGDRLISVPNNTLLNFVADGDLSANIQPWCHLVITKLQ